MWNPFRKTPKPEPELVIVALPFSELAPFGTIERVRQLTQMKSDVVAELRRSSAERVKRANKGERA